eukprot:5234935-Pyramimonas_sp.AAC.1
MTHTYKHHHHRQHHHHVKHGNLAREIRMTPEYKARGQAGVINDLPGEGDISYTLYDDGGDGQDDGDPGRSRRPTL